MLYGEGERIRSRERNLSSGVASMLENQASVGPTWTYMNFWSGLIGRCSIFRIEMGVVRMVSGQQKGEDMQ